MYLKLWRLLTILTIMKNSKNKIRVISIIIQLMLLAAFTFLGGFFVPKKVLDDKLSMIGILIAVWGIALTLFVFIQGVVQGCKSTLIEHNNDKKYVIEKYKKLDAIVDELAKDVKCISVSEGLFFVVVFFCQINNEICQCIMHYVQFLIIGIIILSSIDIIRTMFKLVKINELLNINAVYNKGEDENGK